MTWAWSALAAFVLAGAHLAGGKTRPNSTGLRSFAGGVGVGYVFVIVLPMLSTWQNSVRDQFEAERLVFVVAMIGLCIYRLLEVGVSHLDARRQAPAAAWLHICGFAIYSAIAGFVLASYADRGAIWLMAYTAALGLHFYMNDRFLLSRRDYPAISKWLLASAVLLGWAAGAVAPQHYPVAAFLFALFAGGMMLSILKEELPQEKDSVPTKFVLGVGTIILISFLLPW